MNEIDRKYVSNIALFFHRPFKFHSGKGVCLSLKPLRLSAVSNTKSQFDMRELNFYSRASETAVI